jgi:hypothetical protein
MASLYFSAFGKGAKIQGQVNSLTAGADLAELLFNAADSSTLQFSWDSAHSYQLDSEPRRWHSLALLPR